MAAMNYSSIDKFAIELQQRGTLIKALESFFMLFINVASFFGNALLLIAVYRNKKLRKRAPNLYIASLAASDFLMSIFGISFSSAVMIVGKWPFSDAVCQLQGFFVLLFCAVSLQTLAATAINRYIKTVRSRELYGKIFSIRNAKVSIVALWVLALFAPGPYLIAGHRFFFHTGKAFSAHDSESLYKGYGAYLVLFYVTVPLIIIVLCYARVFVAVRKHNLKFKQRVAKMAGKSAAAAMQLNVEEVRITNTLMVVVLGFLTCWIPIVAIDLTDFINGDWKLPRQVYVAYTCFGFTSTSINPVIYGVMNRHFRKEARKFLSSVVRKLRRK